MQVLGLKYTTLIHHLAQRQHITSLS